MFFSKVVWHYYFDGHPRLEFYDGNGDFIRSQDYKTVRAAKAAETKFHNQMREKHEIAQQKQRAREIVEAMTPELSFEISEIDITIDVLAREVRRLYGPEWKFSRTEARYDSCVVAIFEKSAV